MVPRKLRRHHRGRFEIAGCFRLDSGAGLRQVPGMTENEREIYMFLKTWGTEYVAQMEIARRAGGKRKFHEDANWAKPILAGMAERGILESDLQGRFRIKPVSRKSKANQWVAPDIAQILRESGVEVEGESGTASDDYYEQL
jgi:hypothetical protein